MQIIFQHIRSMTKWLLLQQLTGYDEKGNWEETQEIHFECTGLVH